MTTLTAQSFEAIPVGALLERVRDFKQRGWRFVQVSATRLPDQVELTYSFDLQGRLENLRVFLPAGLKDVPPDGGTALPSISPVYWSASFYENELHDLFNIEIRNMAVDFQGKFYTTSVQHPFGTPPVAKLPSAKPPAPAPPTALGPQPRAAGAHSVS